ncbi:MAG: hypothetical protein LBH35_04440 [Treponema sp.]|jgi:hypothetical protein|nr:hypothetical protein [Treponema sp.]
MGIGEFFSGITEKSRHIFEKITKSIKPLVIAVVCGAVFVVLALLLVPALVRRVPKKKPVEQAGAAPLSLSPEDFFMPPEPDFVPRILLEREPRDGWGEEDARPFWTDPMEENADIWRRRIEKGVDELLEHVP